VGVEPDTPTKPDDALMRAGRIDESILTCRKSVALDPGNGNAKKLIEKMESQKKAAKT
jgi:hypothetical protein